MTNEYNDYGAIILLTVINVMSDWAQMCICSLYNWWLKF